MATWRGIKFPFQRGKEGIPAMEEDEALIKQDLLALLKSRRKSRVMLPDFGTGLEERVFSSTGPLLQAKIIRDITSTVAKYEPRVTITDITVTDNNTKVYIDMQYVVNGVQQSISYNIDRAIAGSQ